MINYNDELIYLVAAANIAGHMEHDDTITVSDDEDLTIRLVYWINEYDSICATTDCDINFFAFIVERLCRQYGCENGLKNEVC